MSTWVMITATWYETLETDFGPLYAELETAPDIEIEVILPEDRTYPRGAQAYARAKSAPAA